MEESTGNKRMVSFFLHYLDTSPLSGLAWVDRATRIFKISWHHLDKIKEEEIPEKFQVFEKWAKWTGKYEGGTKHDYMKYKTRLRCALTRLRDFEEVHKHELKNSEPCRIFRLCDWPRADQRHQAVSPDSTTYLDGELLQCPASQGQGQNLQSQASHPSAGALGRFGEPNTRCSPAMVGDNNVPNQSRAVNNDDTTGARTDLHYEGGQVPADGSQVPAQSHRDPQKEWLGQTAGLQQTASASASAEVTDFCEALQHGYLQPEALQHGYLQPEASVSDLLPLPQDLDSINASNLIPSQPSLFGDGHSEPEFHGHPSNVPTVAAATALLTTSNVALAAAAAAAAPLTTCLDASLIKHGMNVVLFYGKPKREMLRERVGPQGCRLYCGEKMLEDTFLEDDIYGAKTAVQLPMPPVEQFQCENESQRRFIAKTLNAMGRGVLLTLQNGDIHANRLGHCHVWAYKPPSNLPLSRYTPEKVFDFGHFRAALSNAGHRPAPYFILTFGRGVKPTDPIDNPLEKITMHAYVYHNEARRLLESHVENQPAGSLNSSEPALSGLNELDQMDQVFRQMAVKEKEHLNMETNQAEK